MIPNVVPGESIKASQINPVIDLVNEWDNAGYITDTGVPSDWQTDPDNLPWYVEEGSLSVHRPVVYVGDSAMIADQYDELSTEGGVLPKRDHGSFYVGYNDTSSHTQIYDYQQMQELKSQELSSPQKHWSFQHVYDVHTVSAVDNISSVGPWRIAYWNIRPTFGVGSGGDGSISLDLSSLNWVKISSMVSAEGEEPHIEWNDSTSAQIWDYARLENGDIADAAELTSNPGYKFLVRPPDGTPHLKYADLSTLSNVISGSGHGCTCDLSATLTSGVKIGSWTKDNWQTQVDLYCLSSVSADCSCTMSAVVGAETYQDSSYRTNTQIAQFKDCKGNTVNLYSPDSVRFQGNVGAQTKTGWNNIFQFQSMTSSNVQVICQGNTIQCGCYYV